jgi:hypothetical protein
MENREAESHSEAGEHTSYYVTCCYIGGSKFLVEGLLADQRIGYREAGCCDCEGCGTVIIVWERVSIHA